MFENYISKAIEKKPRIIWYLSQSLKTTIQPSSIKTFQHPMILTFLFQTTDLKFYKPYPKQSLVFTCLQLKSFENTVGKGEIACNKQFLLFPQCLLPVFQRTFCDFHKI